MNRGITLLGLSLMACIFASHGQTNPASSSAPPQIIYAAANTNLQKTLDDAPPNSVIMFNPNQQLVLSTPLKVNQPLTLRGLNARLPEKLGKSPLVTVTANGVTIEDFQLYGNTESVAQEERAPLIYIQAGDFRVQRGLVVNSSRHGIYAAPDQHTGDLYGGVIRDIVGRGNARCVVSIGDHGDQGLTVHNVLIENIHCYDSSLRGAVNLKDGNDNITVRDVYASNSVYAVDIQDHKKPGETNRNITVENVYAVKCRHAVRTNNRDLGHQNLTIRNVTAEQCAIPLRLSNTEHLTLDNVRVLNHQISEEPFPPILIYNCQGVFVRDVVVKNSNYNGPALALVDSGDVVIDGFTLQGQSNALPSGVSYVITTNAAFSGLRISHVSARNVKNGGIVLESKNAQGTLSDYLISENLAEVVDHIHGSNALIVNNISLVNADRPTVKRLAGKKTENLP
ncbi:MAG TPA: hypothetical protein VNN22_05200 [Verrucomicrobiae bacterium]|nr:hypothetical protein [Verrucomicrobiae bacterium]